MDIQHLIRQLHGLYSDRFSVLTDEMSALWLDALRSADAEDVDVAVLRWVRQHHVGQAPMLQNLLDTVDLIEEETRALRARHRPDVAASIGDVLGTAAERSQPATASWAQAHVQMFLDGLCVPLQYPQAAARCREYAQADIANREAWLYEAAWWDAGAHGAPVLASWRCL